MSGGTPYRLSSGKRGRTMVILCVIGSFLVHGVAYGVLRAIKKPTKEKEETEEPIEKRKPKPTPAKPKAPMVELLKPMAPPPPMLAPPKAPRRIPPRIIRRPMAPPPPMLAAPMRPAPLNLTMGAGVSDTLVSNDGVGTVHVGDTALGDANIAPMRAVPRPMRVAPTPPPPPPPVRRRAAVYVKDLPQRLTVPQVPYPSAARRAQVEGTVKLLVTVGKDGRVIRVKVLKRLGYGLDEAAVRALKRARFKPAMGSDGKPMVYTIRYRYTFRLER